MCSHALLFFFSSVWLCMEMNLARSCPPLLHAFLLSLQRRAYMARSGTGPCLEYFSRFSFLPPESSETRPFPFLNCKKVPSESSGSTVFERFLRSESHSRFTFLFPVGASCGIIAHPLKRKLRRISEKETSMGIDCRAL